MSLQKSEWGPIRIQYVQGRENGGGLEWPTLEQLAQEHGIPIATLKSRSSREGWVMERNLFHTQLIQKTHEKALEQLAERAAQLDVQAFSVARASLALHAKELIEGTQTGNLTLSDRERILRICDMAHKMGRRALGTGDTSA